MGVTRARVYQLLETCAHVMAVRWPEGKWQLAALAKKLEGLPEHDERVLLFKETQTLMYPERRETVTGEPELVKSAS